MAAHAIRVPRRRRWPRRLAGLIGTAALLGSGVAIALMVMPQKEEATAPPPAAAAKAPKKGKPALTKAQRRARRAAVATLKAEGYEPVTLGDWRPRSHLKVLIGATDSGAMRAFFFSGGKLIGNDDAATSTRMRVVKASGDAVTLGYRVTTGGTEKVRFELQDGHIVVSGGTIPPSSIR